MSKELTDLERIELAEVGAGVREITKAPKDAKADTKATVKTGSK